MQNKIIQRLENIEALLTEQSNKPFTFSEAYIYLGVSSSYLYKLTSKNQIPHSKPTGKLIYFDKKDLDNWTKKNRIYSKEEISQLTSQYSISCYKKTPSKTSRISGGDVI